jgi:hypothetical protein
MKVGESPASIIVDGNIILVANNAGDSVSLLRPRSGCDRDGGYQHPATLLATIPAPRGPFGMAVLRTAGGVSLWVASFGTDSIVMLRAPDGVF